MRGPEYATVAKLRARPCSATRSPRKSTKTSGRGGHVAKLSRMDADTSEHPAGLLDELLGGTWHAPAADDEDYPHDAVVEIQALLTDLVGELDR